MDTPDRTHNLPEGEKPLPFIPHTLDVDVLKAELEVANGDLIKRRDELLDAVPRFDEAIGDAIQDDEQLTRAGAFAKQLRDCADEAEARRVAAKAPYLQCGGAVDGFYNAGISSVLKTIAERVRRMQTVYNNAKAERLRREAAERERREREEAEKKRREQAEAERKKREAEEAERQAELAAAEAKNRTERAEAERQRRAAQAAREQAVAEERRKADEAARNEQAARDAAKTATSSAADLTRVRGDLVLTTTREVWKYEVVDITKVPHAYLEVKDSVIKALIRGKNGIREIPGLRIYPDHEASNRR